MNIETASSLAKVKQKNIFIKYEANWCLPCRVMNETVFTDERVILLLDNEFVVVTADMDIMDHSVWFEKYDIKSLPAMAVLSAKGEELFKMTGTETIASLYNKLKNYTSHPEAHADITDSSKSITRILPTFDMIQTKTAENLTLKNANLSIEHTPGFLYTITVGAFAIKKNATRLTTRLNDKFNADVFIQHEPNKNLYRVNIGRYSNKNIAKDIISQLEDHGIDHYIRVL